jgi:hypothetical protein
LDIESLGIIHSLAKQGLPVCLKHTPTEAGQAQHKEFGHMIESLSRLENVNNSFYKLIDHKPLIEGKNLPEYWCRTDGKSAKIFFSNPHNKNLKYPLEYGQSLNDSTIILPVTINFNNSGFLVDLKFEPYQSVLLSIDRVGKVTFEDISFVPKKPVKSPKD